MRGYLKAPPNPPLFAAMPSQNTFVVSYHSNPANDYQLKTSHFEEAKVRR
jgi:hypothetical protein